jgi:hypothetical protein
MNKNSKQTISKLNGNNKGIALISILIAVAFISIIGSTLLYITYTNFQMKVLNNRSKQNFYETDGELVRITSTLRDFADNPNTVDALFVDNGNGTATYSIDNVLLMAGLSSTYQIDGDTFTIESADPSHNFISHTNPEKNGALTTYYFDGIKVTQKSKDGYENSVQTNIVLKVLQQGTSAGGGTGVGECSMLFDSSIQCSNNGQFSFLTLYGDTYYSSYYYGASGSEFPAFNGTGNYTQPGKYLPSDPGSDQSKPALTLTADSKINLVADYMVIYGDVVLKDNSCLYINSGNLTVYGDIYLLGNSTLVCGGKIYQPSSPLPGRTLRSSFYTDAGEATSEELKKHVFYPAGASKPAPHIAEDVTDDSFNGFASLLHLDDSESGNDGITPQILKTVEYEKNDGSKISDFSITKDYTESRVIKVPANYYGKQCGVAFLKEDVINDDYPNYLVFIAKCGASGGQVMKTAGNQWWDPRDGYNAPSTATWDASLGTYVWYEAATADSGTRIVKSNLNSTYISTTPLVLDVQHGAYISKMGSDVYDYLTLPTDGDPYYDESIHHFKFNPGGNLESGDRNHFSAGDFLQTDANPKVQNLFAYGINGGGGMPTYINSVAFSDYVKDAE